MLHNSKSADNIVENASGFYSVLNGQTFNYFFLQGYYIFRQINADYCKVTQKRYKENLRNTFYKILTTGQETEDCILLEL